MAGFKRHTHEHGKFVLSAETVINTGDANIYVKVAGTFNQGENDGFILSDNKLIWKGESNTRFLVVGVSDLEVNAACTVTYGLFLNGVLIPGAETPHTFVATSKIDGIAITNFIALNYNDEIDVWVKASDGGISIDVFDLAVTFLSITS